MSSLKYVSSFVLGLTVPLKRKLKFPKEQGIWHINLANKKF